MSTYVTKNASVKVAVFFNFLMAQQNAMDYHRLVKRKTSKFWLLQFFETNHFKRKTRFKSYLFYIVTLICIFLLWEYLCYCRYGSGFDFENLADKIYKESKYLQSPQDIESVVGQYLNGETCENSIVKTKLPMNQEKWLETLFKNFTPVNFTE